jgi:ABC-type transporter Mla maintaining outer membrane lipid asymmetry ATPase subunit MlaF
MSMDAPSSNPAIAAVAVIEMNGVGVGSLQKPDLPVLEEVNWRVEAGDYWLLAGMHGSGKSDFMAMTGGLTPPQRGSYRLFGHEMPIYEEELLAERLRLGLVFDGGHLLHRLTVAENLALPLQYHRNVNRHEAGERVAAMLEWTGLGRWADALSGGLTRNWQKRAGLARALMLEPEVLLLDNPLGGLDLRHANWWLDFLGQLSAGGGLLEGRRMTLVATGEDLRPWKDRAGHFAVLQQGRLVTLGRRSALADHREAFVRELLAEGFAAGG